MDTDQPGSVARLTALMAMWDDLAAALPPEALATRLPIRSNTIGAQLWCIVGARESYARALRDGAWAGFTCTLTADGTRDPATVAAALRTSATDVRTTIGPLDWTPARTNLLIDLHEHEAQHQGQLIRYIYGLGYAFPPSWKQRWALDD